MTQKEQLHCPVCRAQFRQQRSCFRCGADLSRLMSLAAKAFILRKFSRKALHKCDFEHSHQLAIAAQKTHPTLTGHRLSILTSWLRLLHKNDTLRLGKQLPKQDIFDPNTLPTINIPSCAVTARENVTISGTKVKKPNFIIRSLKFIKNFFNK
jgi:hypothetical protein